MGPYDNNDDEAVHLLAIESIAREVQRPIDLVKNVYDRELARLKDEATIKDYLLVLTSRRTRESFLQRVT